jgi:sugar phosphate isomerase/epimerase
MSTPLHDFMKVGIIHFMAYPKCGGGEGPILETLKSLATDPFFDVIEVTQMKDSETRRQARALAEQARVELAFGAQPILLGGQLDLNSPDETARRTAIDAVKAGIDQAVELGCSAAAVLSGKVSPDRGPAKQRLVDSLKELCAYGQPKGVSIVLETFDQVPFGKNCLIGPTGEAVEVSEAVRKSFPSFGIMLDLSHLPLLSEPSLQALSTAGEHLVHVHIGNCAMDDPQHPAYGDNHPRFGAPGTRNDVAELAEYIRALFEVGYLKPGQRKTVSFEVKPMPGEDPEAVIAGSKRTLLEAWRTLQADGATTVGKLLSSVTEYFSGPTGR